MIKRSQPREHSAPLRRFGRYGPLFLWIAFILYASSGEFSAENSSRFVRPFLLWLFPKISEGQLAGVHFLTRKVSHLVEYAILAFLARRVFAQSSQQFFRRSWFELSLILVALCSFLDEFKQSYDPSRSASILDSLIDIIGGLTVLYLFRTYDRSTSRSGIPATGSRIT
ncbi:MAG TPA: VanZ family protein [Pyrinomonadaceae bacterium]|nr:VanZ family protein [Pyrinomonadaceae bacterium]